MVALTIYGLTHKYERSISASDAATRMSYYTTPGLGGEPDPATSADDAIVTGQYVHSLARGLAVIRTFDFHDPEMTLSEIARKSDLSRATARRSLLTLTQLGYVKSDGQSFALTAKVLDLGFSYLSALTLPEIAQPHLEELAAITKESTSASVLDGSDIVYVARVPTRRIMSVRINIGTRLPARTTSMGRVMLAALSSAELARHLRGVVYSQMTAFGIATEEELKYELAKVRTQGWAIIDQELEEGLRSVAVPISRGSGQTIAAINVATTTTYHSIDSIKDHLLPPLQLAARRISDDLAASTPFAHGSNLQIG